MVMTCCAFNCPRRASKNSNDEHVTFHCFPKNNQLRKKWIVAICRKDWSPSKYSRICSFHFTADSYDTSGWSSRPKLKADAVPSIFDFPLHMVETVSPRPPPQDRYLPSQSTETVLHDSPPVENAVDLLTDDEFEASAEEKTVELLQFSPEVIIEEEPPIKKARKCFLGDFKDDLPNLSTDDTKSFTAIAKNLLDKKNRQIRLLRQKNRRLEKKILQLESVLENLIASRVS